MVPSAGKCCIWVQIYGDRLYSVAIEGNAKTSPSSPRSFVPVGSVTQTLEINPSTSYPNLKSGNGKDTSGKKRKGQKNKIKD
jgi:hypothetical protein